MTEPNFGSENLRCASLLDAWYAGNGSREELEESLIAARMENSPEDNHLLDDLLLRKIDRAKSGLLEAGARGDAIQAILDQYGAAPLIPAMFLRMEPTGVGDMALVGNGSGRRVVALAAEVDKEALRTGDQVYLSSEQSVLVAAEPSKKQLVGEMAAFKRYASDGRAIIESANEQVTVQLACALDTTRLRAGDTVLWDRHSRLALEKMDDADRNPFVLEEISDLPLSKVGGQKHNLERLRSAVLNNLVYADLAQVYDLKTSNTLLLYGPPGNGKTYLTRHICSEVQRLSGKKVKFAFVNATQYESPFVGVTQQNISALFSSLRNAAEEGCIAVLFIDEVDACARIRGSLTGHHADRALNTFLTEMSGFKDVPNITIIGACNRKDLLDSAFTSRFGVHIAINRPDIQAAREIFAINLDENQPYQTSNAREEMIELGVSRLYAPNAEGDVCTLKLRDGKTRTVAARELVSARLIWQISQTARTNAMQRAIRTGVTDLRVEDLDKALTETRERLADTLTPYNAHNQLDSLPTDDSVIAVEPIRRRSARTHFYVNVA